MLGLAPRSVAGRVLEDLLELPRTLASALERRREISEQELLFPGRKGAFAALCSVRPVWDRSRRYLGALITLRPSASNQRLVQRVVAQHTHAAAQRLRADTEAVTSLERVGEMLELAQRLEAALPHTLRHSLARRLIESDANLAIVQRTLGHSSIATTGIYLTPDEDDLRQAMERATL